MNNNQNLYEEFELSGGGRFYNSIVRHPLFSSQKKMAVIALCIAWLPIAVITAIEGTLYNGVQMPFLMDIGMQARILVALPMFVIIKSAIDLKVVEVAKYIVNSLMDHDEREMILHTAFHKAKKLTSSNLTELIMLLIVIFATISLVQSDVYSALEDGTTSWMAVYNSGSQSLSIAGFWCVFITIPLFQFLLLRWLWRYFVWILLLFRLSKSHLSLLPTHADKSAGLGIILLAQKSFCLFFMANSVVISGQLISILLKYPDQFNAIRSDVIGYIVICLVLLFLPLIFFTGNLMKIKNDGLLQMSKLSANLSRKFEKEWITNEPVDHILERQQIDPSLIFDYSGMFEELQKLRVIPISIRDILGMAITLFVPFIPILFIHFSVGELLQKIMGLLL